MATCREIRCALESVRGKTRRTGTSGLEKEALQAAEIRQLQQTVHALRATLEQAGIEHEHALQAVRSEHGQETLHLKATITELRDKLEEERASREGMIQAATSLFHDEMNQIRETAVSLI